MLLSLSHVTVRCADFERTECFYCDLLGMRIGPRPAIAVPGRWFYIGDQAVLHVLPRTAEAAAGAGGAIDHFALDADDLPAFERRLKAVGQPFESRRLADSDMWQIFLTDPDGARVELCFQMPACGLDRQLSDSRVMTADVSSRSIPDDRHMARAATDRSSVG